MRVVDADQLILKLEEALYHKRIEYQLEEGDQASADLATQVTVLETLIDAIKESSVELPDHVLAGT